MFDVPMVADGDAAGKLKKEELWILQRPVWQR
jgi:hypothetical protein